LVYNDGVGPAGQDVDHDWSNAVFGVSTDIDLDKNLTFTPGIYYQISMDKSVNDEDEFWSTFGLKYKF
jgi:long-subunit fatty acid transport protein